MDYAMFGIYFWCAEMIALYHLMLSHSHRVLTTGTVTGILLSNPVLKTSRWRESQGSPVVPNTMPPTGPSDS
ncbi:hypothetical protein L249_1396 [Ophiocordyceps polyrhachis-furcata BCC 54312]|uniref:Uncharacterized protein n=1 Tax=Ophiocordyceps polyrhachis-furcata BCC 54312 TaxID=1330021 RepID=A0A367L479_9HYPO|nr:hypothetical protein L249_1396 [Ophiocordyceps polyrhachis-furcata BCC 54312]